MEKLKIRNHTFVAVLLLSVILHQSFIISLVSAVPRRTVFKVESASHSILPTTIVGLQSSSQEYVGTLAAPDQIGCVYFTSMAESGQPVQQPDAPNRYALYNLPENYPRSGAVIVTGIEGDPYPLINGIPPSYFQTPQCQTPAIYVVSIVSNGALLLNPTSKNFTTDQLPRK